MSEAGNSEVDDLIRRAQQGDAECRERLFALCRGYLGFAARAQVESWLRVKVDASDLVQQTMLEAHRDFHRFQGGSEQQLLAWLRKILLNNLGDFIRHYRGTAKRQIGREVRFRAGEESGFGGGAPEPAAPDGSPSQEFFRRDNELRLVAALEKLPPDYQEVIFLRNLQRLPFGEVAEQMERSRPAAQMLWKRAIDKLREVMGDET
ncbi:MAG: sigma-70 family RNA polymerase sigma factor [Planctomycetes bacterium]|nr:sigma-70 family RNA polymerase sigma factor [Planctomycetota bacterium]